MRIGRPMAWLEISCVILSMAKKLPDQFDHIRLTLMSVVVVANKFPYNFSMMRL
jgi:hypothetical protein